MKDFLISTFIDDELDIDEKIAFVENVHADIAFKREAVALLQQEKYLAAPVVQRVPPVALQEPWRLRVPLLRPAAIFAAGLAAALLIFWMLPTAPETPAHYRFVLYQPQAQRVDLTGSFTGWSNVPLRRIGESGYWEVTLNVPPGEHRFSYILEDGRRMPDPTIPAREKDDFGGENTILDLNTRV